MSADILERAESLAVAGELACADAHAIAAELGVSPMELGKAINRSSEIRFNRCQLGLFGYGLKAEGKSKIVLAATNVPDDVRAAIEARAANGRLSCSAAWEIADQFKYPRLGIGNLLEALGLRITPCQLGCF